MTRFHSSAPGEAVAGLILAAGQSRRFGSDKRRASCGPGETLLQRSIALAAGHCDRIFVVLRPEDVAHDRELLGEWWQADKLVPVYAERSAEGMGGSLAEGMVAIGEWEDEAGPPFAAVLLMLADMPRIQPATIAALLAARQGPDSIVQPCYHRAGRSRAGHPVLFGRHWFAELGQLSGDRGARRIIEANSHCHRSIAVDDPGILQDMDRPEDLAALG